MPKKISRSDIGAALIKGQGPVVRDMELQQGLSPRNSIFGPRPPARLPLVRLKKAAALGAIHGLGTGSSAGRLPGAKVKMLKRATAMWPHGGGLTKLTGKGSGGRR